MLIQSLFMSLFTITWSWKAAANPSGGLATRPGAGTLGYLATSPKNSAKLALSTRSPVGHCSQHFFASRLCSLVFVCSVIVVTPMLALSAVCAVLPAASLGRAVHLLLYLLQLVSLSREFSAHLCDLSPSDRRCIGCTLSISALFFVTAAHFVCHGLRSQTIIGSRCQWFSKIFDTQRSVTTCQERAPAQPTTQM